MLKAINGRHFSNLWPVITYQKNLRISNFAKIGLKSSPLCKKKHILARYGHFTLRFLGVCVSSSGGVWRSKGRTNSDSFSLGWMIPPPSLTQSLTLIWDDKWSEPRGRRQKKTGTVTNSSIARQVSKRVSEEAEAVRRRPPLFVVRFGCESICSRWKWKHAKKCGLDPSH